MPSSKCIVKKFALGIITKKLQKPINQVTFAEETNTNQRSKFFKWLEKMKMQRKKIKGLNIGLQETSRFPSMKHCCICFVQFSSLRFFFLKFNSFVQVVGCKNFNSPKLVKLIIILSSLHAHLSFLEPYDQDAFVVYECVTTHSDMHR